MHRVEKQRKSIFKISKRAGQFTSRILRQGRIKDTLPVDRELEMDSGFAIKFPAFSGSLKDGDF